MKPKPKQTPKAALIAAGMHVAQVDKLQRQFGARFIQAVAKCPTLIADLKDIHANGIIIRKVGGHCQAYSIRKKKSIYVGSKCKLSYKLISIAHEKIHVLDSPTPDPVPGKTGRQWFIDACLDGETDSIVHEVVIVGELLAAGHEVDDHSMKWFRRFNKGGRAAIRKAIEEAFTSNTGEKYPEYYGLWYDEVVRPSLRLPLFGGDGTIVRRVHGLDPCPRFRPVAVGCEGDACVHLNPAFLPEDTSEANE